MITKNINKLPKGLVEVEVTVPWTDLNPIWDTTLQKMTTDLELPGFRKGAVPAAMAEQNLGIKLQDEVLKVAMPQFLIAALQGSDVVPIDYPKYQLVSFVKGQDLKYKAVVTNRPTVTVGDYKQIKVQRAAAKEINEEEVNKQVEELFKRWSARQGASGQPTQSSSGTAGSINVGGTSSVPNTLPTTPDDNFAKLMGATDLNDLKAKIKKDLQDQTNLNSDLDFEEAILQEVEKITQVELPDILIEDELNRMLVSLQRRVADMGLLLEDYLKGQGKSLDQLKREWRPQAEKNVRMELGLAEIARGENIEITDSELQTEIDKIQDPKVKQQFQSPEPRLHLKHALRQTKTLDLLKKMVV